jgi:hypothetical protein
VRVVSANGETIGNLSESELLPFETHKQLLSEGFVDFFYEFLPASACVWCCTCIARPCSLGARLLRLPRLWLEPACQIGDCFAQLVVGGLWLAQRVVGGRHGGAADAGAAAAAQVVAACCAARSN